MKKYNFDELVDRTKTNCIKYDGRQMFFGTEDVLPLWVADMDFKTPDFIINALKERLEHEVLGYTFRDDSYAESITNWLEKRHAWKVEKEWLSFSPGVVAGLTLAIEAFSKPGDEVIVQPPVYFPFFDSVKGTGRKMVENPLKLENGRYTFDLEDLKQKITPETKLLLLCNPQNPGGMVWTREELEALTAICLENKVLIISDEIHSDLVFEGHKHIPLPTISEEVAQSCVVCMAGSKTFNIAGLTTSFVVIPNKRLLARYERELKVPHLHMGNIFGSVALETAYREGEAWLEQMLVYLQENMQLVRTYLKENLPQVVPMEPEATYLVWLDFNALGLSDEELNERLLKAGVGLNRGVQFGKQGSGYMRINIGCQRSTLLQALECIKAAFA
ncbi:MalY/PatB family protein [Sunxiuqinia elliptica]|uniref:cysteine-S-conjugate beta-lyase n=1 Tax=Sunxiuqinia elliptica TaxID=655355 RepID=A0A4R6H6P0_9BACT|nr:PatB family C-S lyase [Sunxiuqinia elliptica]TDO04013.1 cystathionine beta-lyase [Sunxiuqinia elliptica]TDO62295.1 cystathionine beta-lyase [Sunxiuqinia elliptica]